MNAYRRLQTTDKPTILVCLELEKKALSLYVFFLQVRSGFIIPFMKSLTKETSIVLNISIHWCVSFGNPQTKDPRRSLQRNYQ